MEQEKKTNVFAIVGLVCAIMVGSILGLIFSIIGLKESKKCNSGKGLSIAGIIISIIRILFTILFIVLFLLIFRTTEFKDSYCANLSTNYEEVDLTKLTKVVIGSSDTYNVVVNNSADSYLWVVSPYAVTKVTLNPYDVEIPMTIQVDEHYYVSATLKKAVYNLTITIEK